MHKVDSSSGDRLHERMLTYITKVNEWWRNGGLACQPGELSGVQCVTRIHMDVQRGIRHGWPIGTCQLSRRKLATFSPFFIFKKAALEFVIFTTCKNGR